MITKHAQLVRFFDRLSIIAFRLAVICVCICAIVLAIVKGLRP